MRFGRVLLCLLIACLAIGATGCASSRKRDKKEKVGLAPQPVLVGTVALVDQESRFVLIDGGLLPTPPPDLELRSYTRDLESAELVTSRERRRPFVIADIKSGAPQKGDRVFTAVQGRKSSETPGDSGGGTIPAGGPTPAAAPDFLPQVQLAPAAELDQ